MFSFLSVVYYALFAAFVAALLACLVCSVGVLYLRNVLCCRKPAANDPKTGKKIIRLGFFHPFCNAGGGGERVLWCALRSLGQRYESNPCEAIIYTGDLSATPEQILSRARKRFGIEIPKSLRVSFVYVSCRFLVEDRMYPRFTLLGQSIGSMILAVEALSHGAPDVFIDTTGYAFTFPVAKLLGQCTVVAYVHYPTISTDMLEKVANRDETSTNRPEISQSWVKSRAKLVYYHIFAALYGQVGRLADVIMVNSSWTRNHIQQIWKATNRTFVVYPPCDTACFESFDLQPRSAMIVSIAQFRPEKNHSLQLEAFAMWIEKARAAGIDVARYKLVLIGSCRGQDDSDRVQVLKHQTKELGIEAQVDFVVNAPFETLKDHLSKAEMGLHTMWNEHFGIGVVEMMASGVLTIAHDSGGPKADIVTQLNNCRTGLLACTAQEYADHMLFAVEHRTEAQRICANGREAAARFSDEVFDREFIKAFSLVL